jgi:preprotein translocase subunit SecA
LERRFPEEFGRRAYRKITSVSENKNENVELIVKDAHNIKEKILKKFFRVRYSHELPIV